MQRQRETHLFFGFAKIIGDVSAFAYAEADELEELLSLKQISKRQPRNKGHSK